MTVWNSVRQELEAEDRLSVKQISIRTGVDREKVSRVLNSRRDRGVVGREQLQVGRRRMYFYHLKRDE